MNVDPPLVLITFKLTVMQRINNIIAGKLCKLSSFLSNACKEFDSIAKQVIKKDTRMSIRSVALTINQYNNELKSQLRMLRLLNIPDKVSSERKVQVGPVEYRDFTDEKIIARCCDTEKYFVKAYRSVLNEYFPYKPLRDMLRYQLGGIGGEFMQLNLLNSVMSSKPNFSKMVYA